LKIETKINPKYAKVYMLITNRNSVKRTASCIGDWYKKHCKNELSYMAYTLAKNRLIFRD